MGDNLKSLDLELRLNDIIVELNDFYNRSPKNTLINVKYEIPEIRLVCTVIGKFVKLQELNPAGQIIDIAIGINESVDLSSFQVLIIDNRAINNDSLFRESVKIMDKILTKYESTNIKIELNGGYTYDDVMLLIKNSWDLAYELSTNVVH